MFNYKALAAILGVTFVILFASTPNLEAGHHHRRHCHRSNVSINFGAVAPAPTYVVRSPAYAPVYLAPQPVYVTPQPVVAYPVYETVYVAPQPRLFSGFSFGWFFGL